MRRSLRQVIIGFAMTMFLTACDQAARSDRAVAELVIDEHAGTINGVGLGASPREVRRAFGEPDSDSPLLPTDDVGLPWIVAPPKNHPRDERAISLAYRDMDFLAMRSTGVYKLAVWRAGARTTGGVRLGDPLATARQRYPRISCGIRNENSEYPAYPYCCGRFGAHWIWFGQDPISSITISSTTLG
jgi:hypothetical protein